MILSLGSQSLEALLSPPPSRVEAIRKCMIDHQSNCVDSDSV